MELTDRLWALRSKEIPRKIEVDQMEFKTADGSDGKFKVFLNKRYKYIDPNIIANKTPAPTISNLARSNAIKITTVNNNNTPFVLPRLAEPDTLSKGFLLLLFVFIYLLNF